MKKVEQKSNNKNTGKFLIIKLCIKMGEKISANNKEFTAIINIIKNTKRYKLKKGSERVIIDGIEVGCQYNSKTNEICVKFYEKLDYYFHVITFLAKTTNGKESRETILFYVNK